MTYLKSKPDTLESLIFSEQARQNGRFIEGIDINQYISKIKINSEIISHSIEGSCAGFIAFYCNDLERREAYITLVLTNPRFRGMNIAKNLIIMALASAKKRGFKTCSLEVKSDNQNAIKLYESLGFSSFERKENSKIMKLSLG